MGPTSPRGRPVACAFVLATAMADVASASIIAVGAGGDFQAALNTAQPGDTITLAAGATYTGNFVLPVKAGATPIIVRSATPDALLPAPGVRITPAWASLLAKIRSPNNMSSLRTATGAHHWTLTLLEFQANQKGYGEIIAL